MFLCVYVVCVFIRLHTPLSDYKYFGFRQWKDKCSKLEVGRKHLRQAVQILNEQIDKIQGENAALKKGIL